MGRVSEFQLSELKKLSIPAQSSHKGQNGKLLVIGGSHLFHAASLWALEIASKIVDMVFYSSVPENNQIVFEAKKEFRNGIVVPRENLEDYIEESDCMLIGPGMLRTPNSNLKSQNAKIQLKTKNLREINQVEDEGLQTYYLTKYLLEKYSTKKFVIDAGALQMLDPEWLLPLAGKAIVTPHPREFTTAFGTDPTEENVKNAAIMYKTTILLKGPVDIVCNANECIMVKGGNAGMTKGGTGDVLAGLTAALYCKNDAWLSAIAASYFNKKAGDRLFERVGYYFNSSDLVNEIPKVMKENI